MTLTKHPNAPTSANHGHGAGCVFQYRIDGLPPGENALIAEFPPRGWRILRWNDAWHGNWAGEYASVDEAVEALREELLTGVASS